MSAPSLFLFIRDFYVHGEAAIITGWDSAFVAGFFRRPLLKMFPPTKVRLCSAFCAPDQTRCRFRPAELPVSTTINTEIDWHFFQVFCAWTFAFEAASRKTGVCNAKSIA
jgi:hypothetical protein